MRMSAYAHHKKKYNLKEPVGNLALSVFAICYVLYVLGFFIYDIFLLYYPLWFIGTGMILLSLYIYIKDKVWKKPTTIDGTCFLNMDEIEDERFQRKMKLLELDGKISSQRRKILLKASIYPIIRILVCVAIIVSDIITLSFRILNIIFCSGGKMTIFIFYSWMQYFFFF